MGSRGRARRRSAADEALVGAVFQEHGRALLAYATRLLGDRQTAEDVVQETLVRAWRHPEVLVNGEGSVRGWLLTVVRNLVIDRARARDARPQEVAEPVEPAATTRDHAETVVNTMLVRQALETLSEEHRDVLVEIYLNGKSATEAADTLGVPPGTVRSRSHYALRALRDWAGQADRLQGVSR